MVKIEILNKAAADSSFFEITVRSGTAPSCFLEGTGSVPNAEGGFDVFLDPNDNRAFQKAGRTVGGLGLNKVKVKLGADVSLDNLKAYQFVIGMYSEVLERKGMAVAFDLDEPSLQAVRRDVEFVTLGRIFANSPDNLYHTVDLVQTYYQKLEEAFKKFGGKGTLSFKLLKKGDATFDKECIGLQAVGNSSAHEPCLGIIDYVGEGASADVVDVALVGKGIAFDTGGNDMKSSKFMETMRTDKSGLVYVAAATILAASMGAKKHIRCYMPCAENMVSGSAMCPGDILTYPNGVTVEIANTDAEGRLILADALLQAKKDKPKYLLDAATLTGAAKIAVGRDMCAILNRNNKIDDQIAQAYEYTSEELWLLPMKEYHKRFITAKRADIANSAHGDGGPGASTAAAFLSFFVDADQPWSHLDLCNAYQSENGPYYATGSSGCNIFALAHWIVGSQY